MEIVRKTFRPEIKVVDARNGIVRAIVSTESQDRHGDVIRQSGWDLAPFMTHPVLLSSHDYRDLRSVIGEWQGMTVKNKQLVGDAKYYINEGNDQADWGFNLASKGRAAFSVGFLPKESKSLNSDEDDDAISIGPREFLKQELLEISHVSVPANSDAVQLALFKSMHPDTVLAEIIEEMLEDMGETANADPVSIITDQVWARIEKKIEAAPGPDPEPPDPEPDPEPDQPLTALDVGVVRDNIRRAIREVLIR